MVPDADAVNNALARTEVNEPEAVNVFEITEVLAAGVCVAVVAAALERPLVAISELKVVSVTAGVIVASVKAIKLAPTAVIVSAAT
jgi:uncharacterized membrane protein YvlD (DUF360 family)